MLASSRCCVPNDIDILINNAKRDTQLNNTETKTYASHSPEETRALGARLASRLRAGDVVALSGELGAGKTALTAGALEALGCEGPFASPTFAIVREYEGRGVRCAHFDMYRISNDDELYSTGFYDYLDGERILFIEWSDNIAFALPDGVIMVTITGSGDAEREITISGAEL